MKNKKINFVTLKKKKEKIEIEITSRQLFCILEVLIIPHKKKQKNY